jgi:LuxR family transcriptional regulator, regulator of acetate metabolism
MSVPATGEVFSGQLGSQLQDRLVEVEAEAERLLGDRQGPEGAGTPDRLRRLIDGLTEQLTQTRGGDPAPAVREHQDALERLRQRFEARFDALARVHRAIGELREITSPASMLARAPATLCDTSKLQRALLSLVGGGRMVAQAAYFAGDRAGADAVLEQLRSHPIRLEHPLIETELLRRRRATIVVGAAVHPRVDPGLVELMGWDSYAAAPLVVGGKVIGVLHADRGRNSKLDILDRDVLWEFTSELAQAYESASLRRTLRHEREQMRQFLDWLGARSSELTDAPIRLATVQRPPRAALSAHEPPLPPAARDDRAVFEGLLTRRELDVLRLLADGHTNKAIAEALVISDGTVKFHVNSILRKLRVANRAQAVSRYLRLLGMQSP